MRGPTTTPASIACFSPKTGPPMSRTVVKPRISVSVASSPAMRLLKPTSPLIDCAGVGRTSIACQWASISPGISVRPPPAIRVAPSAAIGAVEIVAIRLPRTSTLDGSRERRAPAVEDAHVLEEDVLRASPAPDRASITTAARVHWKPRGIGNAPLGSQRPPSILRWRWAIACGP